MTEQEKYKNLLKKMIDETENYNIKSSQELIQKLIKELTNRPGDEGIQPQKY